MIITVINGNNEKTFADIKIGEMFQKNRCIALKISDIKGACNAVIIRQSDGSGAISPGRPTFWHNSDLVVPVRKITIET